MTRDDIVRMFEKANGWNPEGWDKTVDELERFANLIAAAEREACAALCDKLDDEYADANPADCAFVIRERGAP